MKRSVPLYLGVGAYTLVSSFFVYFISIFLFATVGMVLESSNAKNETTLFVYYGLILIASTITVGYTSEKLWQRYAQSANRRTQKIVFYLLALALALFWHYRFFSSPY